MKAEDIHPYDWLRIFFGEVPAEFYLELFIRGAIVYLLLLFSMRALGKRMAAQLSRLDLAAMVALASCIGVSMLSPINGLLPPLIIAVIIVLITRVFYYFSTRNEKFESISQGNLDTLVENGVMKLQRMEKVRVTRERLFAQLRTFQIEHLGRVSRMYMEANGKFSILLMNESKPGLLVLPEWDTEFIEAKTNSTDIVLCKGCGAEAPHPGACDHCGSENKTMAVIEV